MPLSTLVSSVSNPLSSLVENKFLFFDAPHGILYPSGVFIYNFLDFFQSLTNLVLIIEYLINIFSLIYRLETLKLPMVKSMPFNSYIRFKFI